MNFEPMDGGAYAPPTSQNIIERNEAYTCSTYQQFLRGKWWAKKTNQPFMVHMRRDDSLSRNSSKDFAKMSRRDIMTISDY